MGPTTPPCKHDGLGCSAFARRYWRNHCCFLFLWVLRWFTSPRCLRSTYGFSGGYLGINQGGFPHSDIPGSKVVCTSPGLIAAYRVLHRLLAPRHSPYTLSSLTIFKLETRTDACPRLLSNTRKSMHTACVWSEKLPFAGYSVVKDHSAPGLAFRASLRGNPSPRNLTVASGTTSPGPPWLTRSQGPFAPLRSFALSVADKITSRDLKPARCSRAGPFSGPASWRDSMSRL
jgi:hypothetical protein